MYKDLIHDLRRYGLTNGTALGRHMGIMDEAADAIETLTFELAAAVRDIKAMAKHYNSCLFCKDYTNGLAAKTTCCRGYEYRGGQGMEGER